MPVLKGPGRAGREAIDHSGQEAAAILRCEVRGLRPVWSWCRW